MRTHFDEQLKSLHNELVTMGSMCEEAISLAIRALTENDAALTEKVFAVDSEIDEKEREIERLCMQLLLKQQPVAKDLREISSALKMISDMERIGDQASDIAEITQYVLKMGGRNGNEKDLKEMAGEAVKMVTDSVTSFVQRDLDLAHAVMKYDDVVDGWFIKMKKELIELVSRDGAKGEYGIDLLMIAKYLERIGDHATNIAEWVAYSITGVHEKA